MKIAGAHIVVTGGGSGIGAAMVRRFAREGAAGLVVSDIDEAAAQAVAREVGGLAIRADVAQEAGTRAVIEGAQARFGPIDLFCANAGITAHGGVELADGDWQRLWDVNVMAHVHAARALVPAMLARGRGHLLFTASAAGLLSQFDAPYAVTKHAAVALAEWLAITHGGDGLGVSCLCPGAVRTPLFSRESAKRQALMGARPLEPQDVAQAVAEGLSQDRFLILPQPEILDFYQRKAADPERWIGGMRKLHRQAREDT